MQPVTVWVRVGSESHGIRFAPGHEDEALAEVAAQQRAGSMSAAMAVQLWAAVLAQRPGGVAEVLAGNA